MKKILFWLAVFGMSMLVMVQPARAAVEQIEPTNGSSLYYFASLSQYKFASPLLACQSTIIFGTPSAIYEYLNPSSYPGLIATCTNWWQVTVGVPVCPVPISGGAYTYSNSSKKCERTLPDAPACPAAGTQHSKGFYNVGTVPTGKLVNSPCVGGCKVELFSGVVPAAKQKINGIYYYYGSAEYKHTGASCSPDTPNFLADFVGTLPNATCAAGQQMISMNGVTKCFNSDGTEASANSASAVAAAKTLADAKIAAQIAAAASAVAAAGGSASDVAAAKTVAAGVAASQSSGTTANSSDPVQAAFCADNPESPMCKAQTEGARTVGTAALDGLYAEGDLIAGKTVSSVIGGFKTRVLSSGIGSAIGGFFTVNQAAGTCPVWSANIPVMGTLTFDFYCQSTFQNLLPWIRSVLLLIFSVIAFRIAVL